MSVKDMRRNVLLVTLAALLLPWSVLAVTVTAPQGTGEVFARGDLFDLIALARLTGAGVQFAPAAGSYSVTLADHQVQFTPGGSLAVVDGGLTALPGPVRVLDGHIVGSLGTAAALLAPLGWTIRGPASAPTLVRIAGGELIDLAVMRGPGGTTVIIRGTAQRPRVVSGSGSVAVQFSSPVQLARPIVAEAELLGGDLKDMTLTLRVAAGMEVAATYALDDPPRFAIRLAAPQPAATVPTPRAGPLVVLDPGHGGEDQGAKAPGGELEKDVTLLVARMTAAQLQAAGVTARLTREGDEAVALTDRTAQANRLQAAVFVSIHANASPAKGARGAETYFMSADASDAQAQQAAARENASASPDTVQLILWDLAHIVNLNESARLARGIQERLNDLHGIRDRGIRQAPFVVLTGATMPAALVEVGFLSNPEEGARLVVRDTQELIARALAEAIIAYLRNPTPTAAPTP
jgi:N-acetylmuramoyl-L-alanine amidase